MPVAWGGRCLGRPRNAPCNGERHHYNEGNPQLSFRFLDWGGGCFPICFLLFTSQLLLANVFLR